MITSIIALVLVVGVLAGPVMSNVERPDYKVVQLKQSAGHQIKILHYNQ